MNNDILCREAIYLQKKGYDLMSSDFFSIGDGLKKRDFIVGKFTDEKNRNYHMGVALFIKNENIPLDDLILSKEELRRISFIVQEAGDDIILYTNYGCEVNSKEDSKTVGFNKISKLTNDEINKTVNAISTKAQDTLRDEWNKTQDFLNLDNKSTERKPLYNVGDYIKYKGGDPENENWYGVIRQVKDFITEYAYRIDAYCLYDDGKVIFDKANNNEKYEVQLRKPLDAQGKYNILKSSYDESKIKDECYIDFLNKDKNFTKDRKMFNTYQDAVTWAKNNFEKFDPDMIHYTDNYLKTEPKKAKSNKSTKVIKGTDNKRGLNM